MSLTSQRRRMWKWKESLMIRNPKMSGESNGILKGAVDCFGSQRCEAESRDPPVARWYYFHFCICIHCMYFSYLCIDYPNILMLFKRGEVTKWNVWFGLQFNVAPNSSMLGINKFNDTRSILEWDWNRLFNAQDKDKKPILGRISLQKQRVFPKKEVRRLIRLIRIWTDDVLDFCKSMCISVICLHSVQESRGIGMATGVGNLTNSKVWLRRWTSSCCQGGKQLVVFLRSSNIVITNRYW